MSPTNAEDINLNRVKNQVTRGMLEHLKQKKENNGVPPSQWLLMVLIEQILSTLF